MNYIKQHKFISGGVAAAALCTGLALNSDTYSTLAKGTVIEEKWLGETKVVDGKEVVEKKHYVLYLEVEGQTKDNNGKLLPELYVLHVQEKDMPLAVLDDIINVGSTIFFRYQDKGLLGTAPQRVYPVGNFGIAKSDEIRVVHPWENSSQVQKKFGKELDQRKEHELHMARVEAGYFDGRHVW